MQELGKAIGQEGIPKGAIPGTVHVDRVLVPLNHVSYAVYQVKPNGGLHFKTILEKR